MRPRVRAVYGSADEHAAIREAAARKQRLAGRAGTSLADYPRITYAIAVKFALSVDLTFSDSDVEAFLPTCLDRELADSQEVGELCKAARATTRTSQVSDPHGEPGEPAALDWLVEEITGGAHGDDETFRVFRQVLEEHVVLPADAFVIGEPVSVIGFTYDGNTGRALTAVCRRQDGAEHVVAAADVVLTPRTTGERCLAAYRRWLGREGDPLETSTSSRPRRQHKAAASDLNLGG